MPRQVDDFPELGCDTQGSPTWLGNTMTIEQGFTGRFTSRQIVIDLVCLLVESLEVALDALLPFSAECFGRSQLMDSGTMGQSRKWLGATGGWTVI